MATRPTRRVATLLCIAIAAAVLPTALFTAPADPLPESLAKLLKERNDLAKRVNGALLEATAHVAKRDNEEVVQLEWSLSYDGPRPPLVVLPPILVCHPEHGILIGFHRHACAYFLTVGRDGEAFTLPITTEGFRDGRLPPAEEHEFVVVPAGEKATGILELPLSLVAKKFQQRWPQTFLGKTPWPLYVQFYYRPSDRGPGDFDAWTGELFTKTIRLSQTERVAALPLPVPRKVERKPEKPIPREEKPLEALDRLRASAGRKKGVQLSLEAQLVNAGGRDTIRMRWTLDYDGRRQPLTILRPSVTEATMTPSARKGWESLNITRVNFWVPAPNGQLRRFSLEDPDLSWTWTRRLARQDQFITVPPGQSRGDTIDVLLKEVLSGFRREYGNEFVEGIRTLYVQMHHGVSDRSERFGLDSWTGGVYSPLLKLEVAK